MAWLAKLDARVQTWPGCCRWLYTGLKWYLAAVGAFLWIMLWWQRHWILGLMQVGIIGYLSLHEVRSE